jgi:hypothetical protein
VVEDPVNVVADALTGIGTVDAGHQQLVVGRVLVADRGDHGQLDGTGIDCAAGGAASDASAAAGGGVAGDRLGARRWAAGEQADNLRGEALAQVGVLGEAALGVALAAACPRLLGRRSRRRPCRSSRKIQALYTRLEQEDSFDQLIREIRERHRAKRNLIKRLDERGRGLPSETRAAEPRPATRAVHS